MGTDVFVNSLKDWCHSFSINSVIMMVMMIFMAIGGIDKVRGNKWGYGNEFDKGMNTIGTFVPAIAAIIAIAPFVSRIIKPIVLPIANLIGADPSFAAGLLLGADMGGYPLAAALAEDKALGDFNGLIVASIVGPTLAFTIPIAFSIIDIKDRPFLAAGTLAGLTSVPFGCFAGGIAMNLTGVRIPAVNLIYNIIPALIMSAAIIAGLWIFPEKVIKGFNKLGTVVTAAIVILTVIAVFQHITGIKFPVFYVMSEPDEVTGMTGLESGILVCGQIGITLAGAFPMMRFITKTFMNFFQRIGDKAGIDEIACSGFIAGMANPIPMLSSLNRMGSKGKLLNIAFGITGLGVFGDFIGFTASVNKEMIVPMVIGKLTAASLAVVIANILTPKLLEKIKSSTCK